MVMMMIMLYVCIDCMLNYWNPFHPFFFAMMMNGGDDDDDDDDYDQYIFILIHFDRMYLLSMNIS